MSAATPRNPSNNPFLRFERPPWTTAVLIPGAFLCGIGAAVLIWRGGERTKRVGEVRERLQKALEGKHSFETELKHAQTPMPEDPPEKSQVNPGDPDITIDEYETVPRVDDLKK